jgi:hypothetical protein
MTKRTAFIRIFSNNIANKPNEIKRLNHAAREKDRYKPINIGPNKANDNNRCLLGTDLINGITDNILIKKANTAP